jgi:hypothetical protein
MLPLDGSGGPSERVFTFEVARASDRHSFVRASHLPFGLRRHLAAILSLALASVRFHPPIKSFSTLNVSGWSVNGDIRLRHFPFCSCFSTSNNARPSTRKSNLRPKSHGERRSWRISSQQTRKLSVSAVRPGHWNLAAAAHVLVATQLDHSSSSFGRQLSVCGSIFFTGPKAADLSMERWTPGEVQVSKMASLKKKFLRGVDGTNDAVQGGGDDPSAAANVRNWTSGTRYTKDSCSLCSAQEKRHKNLQNKESSAAVP